MTIVLESTTTETGTTITVERKKYSTLYYVHVTDKYGCHEKRDYMSLKSAKRFVKQAKERY